jgi:glycosyltransferase involved in cell wall biosynthesis
MTALGDLRLVCLAPDTVVPTANGSAARTLGLADTVRPHLRSVTIQSFSEDPAPAHRPGGVDFVHLPRPTTGLARARYLASAVLGPTLGFRFPRGFGDGGGLVQLESPLLFEAARRAGLRRFVLDAHNIYQDMAVFPQALLKDRIFFRLTRGRQTRIELACWTQAAHVIFCSRPDRDRAERLCPGVASKSTIVPNCVAVGDFVPRPADAFGRGGPVLFIGTSRYPPNFWAIQEICRDVAPALPHLEFRIVGDATWVPRPVPANVRLVGRVESTAGELAAAQVAIAPIHYGSGTRLKLLEYFAAGLPVICTPKAAEGLEVQDGRHLRLVDTPDELIARLRTLHGDADTCARLGAAARALVAAHYDWHAYLPALLAVYETHGSR